MRRLHASTILLCSYKRTYPSLPLSSSSSFLISSPFKSFSGDQSCRQEINGLSTQRVVTECSKEKRSSFFFNYLIFSKFAVEQIKKKLSKNRKDKSEWPTKSLLTSVHHAALLAGLSLSALNCVELSYVHGTNRTATH